MLALEWRLTLLALVVLPLFIIPAKRVGKRFQALARQQMNTNAEMNTQMTERFNVAGAQLVKLFGRSNDETTLFSSRAAQVRDIGIKSAMYGRVFFVALGLVGALGAAAIYGIGAHLVVTATSSRGTLVALAALVTRVYQPLTGLTNARVDLMTAMVSFERVFEVLDAPEAIVDRPGAVDLVDPKGLVEFDDVTFRYPTAAEVTVASLEAPNALLRPRPRPRRARRTEPDAAPRRDGRAGRRVRLRQDHAGRPDPPALRRHRRQRQRRRPRRARPHPGDAARRDRCRQPGPAPVPRVDRRQPALRQARRDRSPSSTRRAGARGSTTRSPRCPTATTRWSASAATG